MQSKQSLCGVLVEFVCVLAVVQKDTKLLLQHHQFITIFQMQISNALDVSQPPPSSAQEVGWQDKGLRQEEEYVNANVQWYRRMEGVANLRHKHLDSFDKTKKKMLALIGGLVVLLALEAGAASVLNLWARGGRDWLLASGVGLYALVGLVFGFAKKYGGENLTVFNALWQVGNLSLVTLIGVLAFKDRLTPAQWVGVALAFAAAICFVY